MPDTLPRSTGGTTKLSPFRERYATDFDLELFITKLRKLDGKAPLSKTRIAYELGVGIPAVYQWRNKKHWPLSAYKAVVECFAPNLADTFESRQVVMQLPRIVQISERVHTRARRYDQRRSGFKMALADGTGFYIIPHYPVPAEETPAAPEALPEPAAAVAAPVALPPLPTQIAPPFLALMEPSHAPDAPAEHIYAAAPNIEDVLLTLLARVTGERNGSVLDIAQLRQSLADKDALLAAKDRTIDTLRQSIREWEQLAARQESASPLMPTLPQSAVERAIDVIKQKGTPDLQALIAHLPRPQERHQH